MTFFNKKEEVLDVQLTSEGRRLLSLGRFKPSYYEFYDDAILYDISYAEGSEAQNLSQDRILDNSQYPKTSARFVGAVEKGQTNYKNDEKNYQNLRKNVYLNESPYLAPLGSYDSQKQEAPYFELELLSKNENGIVTGTLQSIDNAVMKIPQINLTCSYKFFANPDDDIVYYTSEPIYFSLKEYNTQFSNFTEDFEVELYEITETDSPQPKLFILDDDGPQTPESIAERFFKESKIRNDVENLVEESLEVLFDQKPELLFGVELIKEDPQATLKVDCTDNEL